MRTTVNGKSVIKMLGVLILVICAFMILPVVAALLYKEYDVAKAFGMVMVPGMIIAGLLMKFYNPSGLITKERDGYIIVALCWLVASILGAIPMVICGAIPKPWDAFFEMCSGFSTTGSTILTDIESLPKSALFWRSFTHWIGGMGIIVFAAALIPSIGIGGQLVASAETPGPVLTKVSPKFSDTAKNLYTVYILFTVVETVLLFAGGMSIFDALTHSFGTVGTGGFSPHGESVGYFNSPYIEWVIIVFMLLCGINFNLYFYILRGRFSDFFKDEEFRLYIGTVGGCILMITICIMTQGDYTSLSKAFRDASFHVSSIITTTGYGTMDYDNLWPSFAKMLILFLTITGAMSSSTGGGVKFIRVLTGFKFLKRAFFNKLHPNRIGDITINGRGVPQSVVTNIINFLFFYVAVLFAGTLIVSLDGYDFVTNITAVLTCLSNVGPGLSLVGPSGCFSMFSPGIKVFLGILMIAGRLELFTLFIIFSPHYWNSNRV